MVAMSSRNNLLSRVNLNKLRLITHKLINLKKEIIRNKYKSKEIIYKTSNNLIKTFKIKIEYIECRDIVSLKTNINNKSFKIFVAFYLDGVRLIDNF